MAVDLLLELLRYAEVYDLHVVEFKASNLYQPQDRQPDLTMEIRVVGYSKDRPHRPPVEGRFQIGEQKKLEDKR